MPRPGIHPFLVKTQFGAKIFQHPEIVDRVDIARHDLGKRANPRPLGWVAGYQQRIRINLVQILDDRQALAEHCVSIDEEEIGRASCRERVCQYVWISVGAVSLKKKKEEMTKNR